MASALILLAALVTQPYAARADVSVDWPGKMKISINKTEGGAAIRQQSRSVVLVRLHDGNFNFADVKPDGSNIRFMAGDGSTPLKYQVEKFDPANGLALIWVQVPGMEPSSGAGFFWMVYGNEKAGGGGEDKALYDVNQVAAFHFSEKDGPPQDQTAYRNNAGQFSADRNTGSLIGAGAIFNGAGVMTIPASPSLSFGGANGFTFSGWVKITAPQKGALLFEQRDGFKRITVGIEQTGVFAAVDAGSGAVETPRSAVLSPNVWHHVAVTAEKRLTVYLDGKEAVSIDIALPEIRGDSVIGKGFTGELDEIGLANVARGSGWVKVAYQGQGQDSSLLDIGEQEGGGSDSASYLGTILHSVTLDGWVVIAMLMVMAATSWMVMLAKALVINKTEKDNRQFVAAFHELKMNEMARLNQAETGEDSDLQGSPVAALLFGKHDHYQNSTLYRIYHAGMLELEHRFGMLAGRQKKILSPQAIDAIKANLDATLVRETQKLNSLMVLLTIAISGGPFLGLLGTVVGVMITFAAIAATGDVNVAAIAPGIAAALVATVAGLVVAIPALFGYNYLGSRIKNITADMHVFVDEFLSRIAESHSK